MEAGLEYVPAGRPTDPVAHALEYLVVLALTHPPSGVELRRPNR